MEIHHVQWRQVPTVRYPHVLHTDKFVNRRIVTYRQVHTDSTPSRKQRMRHMFSSLIVWKNYLNFDAGANDTKRHGHLWKFTERKVDVPVVQREQVQ